MPRHTLPWDTYISDEELTTATVAVRSTSLGANGISVRLLKACWYPIREPVRACLAGTTHWHPFGIWIYQGRSAQWSTLLRKCTGRRLPSMSRGRTWGRPKAESALSFKEMVLRKIQEANDYGEKLIFCKEAMRSGDRLCQGMQRVEELVQQAAHSFHLAMRAVERAGVRA